MQYMRVYMSIYSIDCTLCLNLYFMMMMMMKMIVHVKNNV